MQLNGIDQNVYLKLYPAIAANVLLIVFALMRRPYLKTYLLFFAITTLVDILVAGKIVPIADDNVRTAFEYVFVLIGDLRYIILLAYMLYAGRPLSDVARFRPGGDVLKPTLIFTLFPTLLVSAIAFAKPNLMTIGRHRFLAYELIFFVLTFLWMYVVLPQKPITEVAKNFLRRASLPVFGFYGLWATADMLILNGIEAGYALRIIPNLLYYCGFLWWIAQISESKGER